MKGLGIVIVALLALSLLAGCCGQGKCDAGGDKPKACANKTGTCATCPAPVAEKETQEAKE